MPPKSAKRAADADGDDDDFAKDKRLADEEKRLAADLAELRQLRQEKYTAARLEKAKQVAGDVLAAWLLEHYLVPGISTSITSITDGPGLAITDLKMPLASGKPISWQDDYHGSCWPACFFGAKVKIGCNLTCDISLVVGQPQSSDQHNRPENYSRGLRVTFDKAKVNMLTEPPYDVVHAKIEDGCDSRARAIVSFLQWSPRGRYSFIETMWALGTFVPPDADQENDPACEERKRFYGWLEAAHRNTPQIVLLTGPYEAVRARVIAIGGGN